MCQCRFTDCKKCATLVQDVDSGGNWGGGRVVRKIDGNSLYFPLNFFVNLKLPSKIKSIFKKSNAFYLIQDRKFYA